MSKNYRISTNQVQVRHELQRKIIKYLSPLPDQRAFIIYSSQEQNEDDTYIICNLLNGQINKGPLFSKPEKIENINDDLIVYVDSKKQKLQVFSINKQDFIKFNDVAVPSLDALPQNQRTQEQIGDAITDLTIIRFSESKSIVVIEKKQATNQNQVEFIMSAYCFDEDFLESKNGVCCVTNPIKFSQQNLQKVYGQLNNTDTVIISSQQFQEGTQSKFLMWNFKDKTLSTQLQHISLSSSLEGTIINITPWQKPSEIAFWLNGKPGKPQIIIYDYISKTDYEYTLKVYTNLFLLVNVYEVNFEKERIILNIIPDTQHSCIDIINPIKNRITYTQDIDNSQDTIQFSSDYRYFITNENSYDVMGEDCCDSRESLLTIHSVIGIKTSLMNFLLMKKIVNIYGEEASKAIIDMLTDEDNEASNK
ncbi:hypothetical protein ABPG72_010092 [Tetrahymena utriculariae]